MPADPIHTLADLENWSFSGTALAVLGHPIKHSLSPPMHHAALAGLARTAPAYATWRYFRFDVPPEELPRALALLHAKRFRGLNLTVPHKVLAVAQVAAVDAAARPVGAVNTLRWSEAPPALRQICPAATPPHSTPPRAADHSPPPGAR